MVSKIAKYPHVVSQQGHGDLHVDAAAASWDSLSCVVTVLSELRVLGEEGG